ncbi:hypothetical protein CRG98_030997 [Punica granatum]|uniref:Uncharacterized protein n=1 Tax=Punica granatum TaxID=22663 RepID=A0A2I0IX56_PUNGR|nr:hypothetical protein CRG98_030997 [Punica granatum]
MRGFTPPRELLSGLSSYTLAGKGPTRRYSLRSRRRKCPNEPHTFSATVSIDKQACLSASRAYLSSVQLMLEPQARSRTMIAQGAHHG